MKQVIELKVNGQTYEVMVSPRDLLVDVLRGQLGFTGTKQGCGTGDCGACTVLMDGRPKAWRNLMGLCTRFSRHLWIMARFSAASVPRA